MSTSLIATLAALGLMALFGVAFVFAHMCGVASEKLVSGLVQIIHQGLEKSQATPVLTPVQIADLAESERIDALIKAYDRSMRK